MIYYMLLLYSVLYQVEHQVEQLLSLVFLVFLFARQSIAGEEGVEPSISGVALPPLANIQQRQEGEIT